MPIEGQVLSLPRDTCKPQKITEYIRVSTNKIQVKLDNLQTAVARVHTKRSNPEPDAAMKPNSFRVFEDSVLTFAWLCSVD